MTILFFTRRFYPDVGGVEKHVYEVGKSLVKRGQKFTVLTEQPEFFNDLDHFKKRRTQDPRYLVENVEGMHVIRIPAGRNEFFKKFRIWWWMWQHRELLEKADIIHCHDVFFWYLPFRFLYPAKPVYATFHGYEMRFPPAKKAIIIRKLSELLSWGNICVGEYIKKWYRTKATVITYGGVTLHKYHATVHGSYVRQKISIAYVGRLGKDIGIDMYLKALDILKEKHVSYTIIFLGDGKYKSEARKYGEVKSYDYDDMNYYSDLLGDVDIVFASSYLAILEAMAAKKLVFAVYNNALKYDYLTMTPFAKWIVTADSAQTLVEKMQFYLTGANKEKQLVDRAYEWVKDQTWDSLVRTYLKLWKFPEVAKLSPALSAGRHL